MSKSIKTITAKPHNQVKVSDKNKRQLIRTLEVKIKRENELDPNFTMRNNLQAALLNRPKPRVNNGIYGPY